MSGLLPADSLKQIKTLLVESFNSHLRPAQTKLADHLIEGSNSTLIPNVS